VDTAIKAGMSVTGNERSSNYISFNEYIKANIKHLNSLVWFRMNPDLPLASLLCRVTQQLIGGRVYKRQ